MNSPTHQVRRATVDDLNQLRPLWEGLKLPAADLEKRLTEFQIIEGADGTLLGGIGLQISNRHGLLHSEIFADFSLADLLREQLWTRVQQLSANRGLVRLWTRETAPFWSRNGFLAASGDLLQRLPATWNDSNPGWLSLQLKEESTGGLSPEEQAMRLFVATQKEESEKLFRPARIMKRVATVVMIVILALVLFAVVFIFRKNPNLLTPGR